MSRFKYSVGPWNVHEGADAYGPAVRETISFEEKIKAFKEIGFDAVQFHDDDAVPNLNNMTEEEIIAEAKVRADGIVRQAENDAVLERKKAEDGIKKEIVEVSSLLTEKMLGREVSAADHQNFIDSFIESIGEDDAD